MPTNYTQYKQPMVLLNSTLHHRRCEQIKKTQRTGNIPFFLRASLGHEAVRLHAIRMALSTHTGDE